MWIADIDIHTYIMHNNKFVLGCGQLHVHVHAHVHVDVGVYGCMHLCVSVFHLSIVALSSVCFLFAASNSSVLASSCFSRACTSSGSYGSIHEQVLR